MYKSNIDKKFTSLQLHEISKAIYKYFVLVLPRRIHALILQVDSIDVALHLLFCHKESNMTLDAVVYEWLYRKDNK